MQGKYVEAEASLNDGLQEDPNNTDILVNLLVNSQFMGKPQEVNDLYNCKLEVLCIFLFLYVISILFIF